jgi:hypothetical protein
MYKALSAIVFAVISLTGCGSMRLVDTEVRSFATPPTVPAGATYRFERLPSQQADAVRQDKLEAMAQQALNQVGLQRGDRTASHSVQVTYGMKVDAHAPWEQPEPAFGWNLGWGLGRGGRGGSVTLGAGVPFGHLATSPYYWRQISVVMRSLATHQVVYESHATHDGRWVDTEAVLPALFEAALKAFPNPPPGVRRINIEIPR